MQREVSVFAVSDAVALDNPEFLFWRSPGKHGEHPFQQ
jgi:hypothetical protein